MWVLLVLLLLLPALASAQQCTQGNLNVEFATDPTGQGYGTCAASNDACVLAKFNAPCTASGCQVAQVITREQLYALIDVNELRTRIVTDPNRKDLLLVALSVGTFDLGDDAIQQKLGDIFPGPQTPKTNASLAAIRQKNVSRAEVVCGRRANLRDVSLGRRGDQ